MRSVARTSGLRRAADVIVFFLLLNAPFVAAHPAWGLVEHQLPRSLLINLVIFILPGLPAVEIVARWWPAVRHSILWVVSGSLVVFTAVLLLLHGWGAAISGETLWNATWVATTALAIISTVAGNRTLRVPFLGPEWIIPVFLFFYVVFFVGASRVVPVLDDQDDELQETTHGLLVHLTPSMPTGRNTSYMFAHPPLSHFYAAQALAYNGLLEELAVYDTKENPSLTSGEAFEHFRKRPHLIETRTTSLFLSALTLGLLFMWATRLSGSRWIAAVVTVAYASLPEIFVRSSYAGYFAIGSFLALQVLMALERWLERDDAESKWLCATTGLLCALADHKLVLLPVAVVIWDWLRARGSVMQPRWRLHPVALGFLIGTTLFWSYGLAISPADFWADHVRHHIVDRIIHHDPRGPELSVYPNAFALWKEFFRDTGVVLVPLGAAALAYLCFFARGVEVAGRRNAESGWWSSSGVWLLWAALLAVAFSVTDWRQTKHLAPIALPCVLALARSGSYPRARFVIGAAALAVIALSLPGLRTLVLDFASLPKVPEW